MKLLIFGATGRTGQELVQQALAANHEVTAFVRDPARVSSRDPRLQIVQGNVREAGSLAQSVAGQDAVISALGTSKGSGDDFMTVASTNIVAAMRQAGVRRLIWQSGAGVQDEGDGPSPVRNVMVVLLKLLSPKVYADSIRTFEIIKHSGLDWTVVRVPRLKDGPQPAPVHATFVPPGATPISRADVARFMLEQLNSTQYAGKAPMISY